MVLKYMLCLPLFIVSLVLGFTFGLCAGVNAAEGINVSSLDAAAKLQKRPVNTFGRVSLSRTGSPVLYWSGSALQAKFTGTSLGIALDDHKGASYYNVIIDGADDKPLILDTEHGDKLYKISGLPEGEHEALLFRRTEATDGPTDFLGFVLDDGAKLLPPPPMPERKIEFYGDSITCGMGIEGADKGPDDKNNERNNYLAYGAVASRMLGAEYRCIGRSGIGLMKSWYDLIMPDYWYRVNPDDSKTRWDFSKWTPDVVVVNLFQNDKWLIKRLKPVPNDEQIVQAYVDFISSIRKVYPKAHIVCSLGSMSAAKEGGKWPGYIVEALKKMNDKNTSFLLFPNDGWGKHPRVRHHKKMADMLVDHLKKVINW